MKNYQIDRKLKGDWIRTNLIVVCSRQSKAINYASKRFPGETVKVRLISGPIDIKQFKVITI